MKQRVSLTFELAGQLLNRSRQDPHTVQCDFFAAATYCVFVAVTDRMRHYDDGKTQMPRAFARDLTQRGEGRADDGYSGYSEIFELYRVTRGPWG